MPTPVPFYQRLLLRDEHETGPADTMLLVERQAPWKERAEVHTICLKQEAYVCPRSRL
uniref:Uncharacterized protein n=1 Tax=Setaria viridis TaxID=4556 RepID=A0A4U6TSE3_SETVI|nr:hypothetical protein SEVIR_8G114850v2 [Setaria viridis]